MARKIDAASYMRGQDPAVRIILAELAESSAKAGWHWGMAHEIVERNPERAIEHLARLEIADTLRPARRAIELLARELPDDEEDATQELDS